VGDKGNSGRVASVDQITKQIKIEVRGSGEHYKCRVDAKRMSQVPQLCTKLGEVQRSGESNINDIQAGDMLRALGDRSPDGASFAAEEIVTGAFRTVAGTVKTVDVAKNEVVIADFQSKKDITVELGSASVLKKFLKRWPSEWRRFSPVAERGPVPADREHPERRRRSSTASAGNRYREMLDSPVQVAEADVGSAVAAVSMKCLKDSRLSPQPI
jgi:hypothetical protein